MKHSLIKIYKGTLKYLSKSVGHILASGQFNKKQLLHNSLPSTIICYNKMNFLSNKLYGKENTMSSFLLLTASEKSQS